jgi:membrane fusion protein (multidrug efflux system)
MKTYRLIYTVVTLFAGSLFLASCGQEKTEDAPAAKNPNKVQTVEVEKPQQRSFDAEILITGKAQPNQHVMLYAMESGFVKNISADIGDVVRTGQKLVELGNPELTRQREEKKAQFEAKEAVYNRLNATYEQTPALTSIQMVEDAQSAFLSAKAAYNSVQDKLNFLTIKAPFNGIITKRMIDHGALVQSGLTQANAQGILEIQETNPIRLTIPLPESDIAGIAIGMEANVLFPDLQGEAFNVNVSRMAGALDPASNTMQVEFDIENDSGVIKPGMYAKVLIQTGGREGVLSLPVTAQWIYQNQPFVMIVNEDNVVERIPLRKGISNKDYFEVLNPEINANTQVIIQGKGMVTSGQTVRPILKSNAL